MKTRRLSRQTAAKAAVRFATTGSGVDLDGPSESDRLKRIYAQCVAEVEQENAAQQHAALAPVREVEAQLTADRIEKMRRARIDLMNPDYPYFAEICPAYAQYAGTEDGYLGAVRAAFISLRDSLASQGVTVTQAGLDLLGQLADDNRFIDWSSTATFTAVWGHCVEVQFLREGRDFTVKQTQPEPAPQPRQVEPQSCDELRTAAEEEYLAMAQPIWEQFQSYLLENWGVTLTTSQRHEAIETAKRLNINPCLADGWILVKNSLVRRQVIPDCRTVDEKLSSFIDTVPDCGSPNGKRLIAAERNRLMSEEYKKY